jgi:hypothetical protein
VGIVGLSLAATRGRAAAACPSTCTQQLAACKRTCPGSGQGRRDCRLACTERSTCTAPGAGIRTFAYVVNECHRDAQGLSSFSQKLLVRRGNCDPATVLELPPVGPVSDPLGDAIGGACHNFGAYRAGSVFPLIGRFQRVGVLPDGSGVVVDITNDPRSTRR